MFVDGIQFVEDEYETKSVTLKLAKMAKATYSWCIFETLARQIYDAASVAGCDGDVPFSLSHFGSALPSNRGDQKSLL